MNQQIAQNTIKCISLEQVSGNVVISEVDVRTYVVLRKTEKYAPYGDLVSTTGRITVAQLVEVLRYKPEGRGFDSGWCHWNFSLTGRTMALGPTQPLTEMSNKKIFWG